jgi:hypothetical protein
MIVALARGARRDAVRQKFGSCMTRFVNRSSGGANDFFTDAALAVVKRSSWCSARYQRIKVPFKDPSDGQEQRATAIEEKAGNFVLNFGIPRGRFVAAGNFHPKLISFFYFATFYVSAMCCTSATLSA